MCLDAECGTDSGVEVQRDVGVAGDGLLAISASLPPGRLFASGAPIAREADDHLPGFGER